MQTGSIWRIKRLYIAPRPTITGADIYFSEEKNITLQVPYSQEYLVGTGMGRQYAFRKSLAVITGGKENSS